uniref:GmrSD restriction endonucleases N-terminal domain-containing protein n=1 Tax=viral metagenome TaxID=1070528 RepID=A0A6C0C0X5_9ZZZZ
MSAATLIRELFNATESLMLFDSKTQGASLVVRSISQYLEDIEIGKIESHPTFQRSAGVWTIVAQRRLIRSIAQGYPIPPLYLLYDESQEVELLVDGLQRTTAMHAFYKGELGVPLSFFEREASADLKQSPNQELVYFTEPKKQNHPRVHVRILSSEDQRSFKRFEIQIMKLTGPKWKEKDYLHFFFTTINYSVDLSLGEKLWGMQHPFLTRVVAEFNALQGEIRCSSIDLFEAHLERITGSKPERKKAAILILDVVVYAVKLNRDHGAETRHDIGAMHIKHETHLRTSEHAKVLLDSFEAVLHTQRAENSTSWLANYHVHIAKAFAGVSVEASLPFYQYRAYVIFRSIFTTNMFVNVIDPVFAYVEDDLGKTCLKASFYSDKTNFEYQIAGFIALFRLACDTAFLQKSSVTPGKIRERFPMLDQQQIKLLSSVRSVGSHPYKKFASFIAAYSCRRTPTHTKPPPL